MSEVRDEMPDTEFGLNKYIDYCQQRIKDNLNHNKRLNKRIEWAEEKLEKIKVNETTNG